MFTKYERFLENPDEVSTLAEEEIEILLEEAEKRFELEQNLIELETGCAIFVGDTHGDFHASKDVTRKYLKPPNKVIFLGDYVDRGQQSRENINYLLALKLAYPDNLYLLMGNHEAHSTVQFYPADFWEQLAPELYSRYASALSKLPLAVSARNGVIALHGALPAVETVEAIDSIELGSEEWRQIAWGDWQEGGGGSLGEDIFTGRPQFGQEYFKDIMSRFKKNVLIRSHQPTATRAMYDNRCLTIFTSSAYSMYISERIIAVVDLEKKIETVADLIIETV